MVVPIFTHPTTRRHDYVVTTSLCTPLRHRRYVSNETPNDVSTGRPQDVSVVCLYNISLERTDDVSRGRNNDIPSVYLNDVSNNNVVVVCLRPVSELLCCNALLVSLYYFFKLLCHDLHLVGFHISFKYQIKNQIFLVPT